MKSWRVWADHNGLRIAYLTEADTPEQAVEDAKEWWREQADELPWEIEEMKRGIESDA
jgi:hypothetical protein